MYATDFLFDRQRASDFGCMICSFDGGLQPVSGGEIECNAIKTPGTDTFTFYGSQFNSALTWTFSICKNPCKNKDIHFSQYEESMIMKWLAKTDGYRWLQFNQEGYEDIFYKVNINALPHQVAGRTIGFDLTATSNCAYGFTDVITKKASIALMEPFLLNIHSDIDTYILPIMKVKYKPTNPRPLSFDNCRSGRNFSYGNADSILDKPIKIENMSQDVTMDSDMGIIKGLARPNDFNWSFLKLVNGTNVIMTDHGRDIEIELQYREPRYVRV